MGTLRQGRRETWAASGRSGFQCRDAIFHLGNSLIEVANNAACHDQHRRKIPPLLALTVLKPLESIVDALESKFSLFPERSKIALNFLQDVEHRCFHVLCHAKNIT